MQPVRVIRERVPVIRDISQAPIFVLHAKQAMITDTITVSWNQKILREDARGNYLCDKNNNYIEQTASRRFDFDRVTRFPLPTIDHCVYLDAMLMLFASQPEEDREKGVLYFKYVDILAATGKNPKSSVAPIKETIKRYMKAKLVFTTIWPETIVDGEVLEEHERVDEYSIIKKASIFGSGQDAKNTHIGRSKKKEYLHWIQFDQEIVEQLKLKKAGLRYFLSSVLKETDASSFAVYRYFFGFGDNSKIWKSLNDLKKALNYSQERLDKFKIWLNTQFSKLMELGLIHKPFWNDSHNAVLIKCFSIEEIRQKHFFSSLKKNVSSEIFSLYKIFSKKPEQKFTSLMKILNYANDELSFKGWLMDKVDELANFKLVERHFWTLDQKGVFLSTKKLDKVIIKNIDPNFEMMLGQIDLDFCDKDEFEEPKSEPINITPSSKRQGASSSNDENQLLKLSDEDTFKKYLSMKEKYNLPEITTKVIDLHIKKKEFSKAVKAINGHVLNKEFSPKVIDTKEP